MATTAVLGAGIAGLTAAYHLEQNGADVEVLEARPRVGGVIRSERRGGFLVEHGPNSLRSTDPVLGRTIEALGLGGDVVPANDEATRRYVVRDGRPHPLPSSLGSFLTTPLLSTRAKLRLLGEPFAGPGPDGPESVASFVRRRLGPEVLDYAVNPFVGGVFAGDPERLSVRHAFERLCAMEREHGSLFRALLARLRSGGSDEEDPGPNGLFSFRGGLERLPGALAGALEGRLRLETRASGLRHDGSRWRVAAERADGSSGDAAFESVVCALPLHRLAGLAFETPVDLDPVEAVPYPPVSVLALGFRRSDVRHPLDGFGMLVPEVESDFDVLGTLFSSTLFPNRAPEGHVLLTTFAGGMRNPDLAEADDAALRERVKHDLDRLLGLEGTAVFERRIEWPRAIPQYTLDHGSVVDTLEALEERHPGLVFAGNYRSGVAVSDAMASGAHAAERLAARLARTAAPAGR
jgi:oxygen-dependent protoporphyrinogen oxidase